MVNSTNLLVSAREIAEEIERKKCIYSNSGLKRNLDGVLKTKKTSCANYVCLVLQTLGILKPGQMFYFDNDGNIKFNGGDASDMKKRLNNNFDFINVGKKGLPSDIKPGDICGWKGHTNIFAGFKDGDKSKAIWWDCGRSGTSDGKAESGPFTNIHRKRDMSSVYMTYILRLKTNAVTYYPKYLGYSNNLDNILENIGVPSKYRGSKDKRKPLAKLNGISNYQGTLAQNIKLKNLAKKGTLRKS